MKVATIANQSEVGVRELKNNLSRYLERVGEGESFIVTERGRPIASLSTIDGATHRLAALVDAGLVQPPTSRVRRRPTRRIAAAGSVSELATEQRG